MASSHPAQLQQAAAELLVALGVAGLLFEGAAQQRLGLPAAALGVQCRAEQRQQVGLAREIGQRVAAEPLGHDAVACAQERDRALKRSPCKIDVADRRTPGFPGRDDSPMDGEIVESQTRGVH